MSLQLDTLTLFLSWRCSIRCDHCGFSCAPNRRGQLPLARGLALIEEAHAASPGLRMVAYSGGEPFLFYPDLLALMRAASARGLAGGVVTNCSWANVDDLVGLRLEALQALGLAELIVSLDRFHLAHVPLENIRRVARGASTRGIRLGVNVLMLRGEAISDTAACAMLGLDRTAIEPGKLWIQTSAPVRSGRAARFIAEADLIRHPEAAFRSNRCQYVTRNMVVTPELDVYACCGFGA
jgi:hypothetical protein